MHKDKNGFGLAGVILIVLLVAVITLIGWLVFGSHKVTVTTTPDYTRDSNCYDADGSTFVEDIPPESDQLTVKPAEPNTVQLTVTFKKDANNYKLSYDGICVITEKVNGQTTKTINLIVQKIEQPSKSDLTTGLNIKIGNPNEFTNDFKPSGNYDVRVVVHAQDSTTNKSLGSTELKSHISF